MADELKLKNGKEIKERHPRRPHQWWRSLIMFFVGFVSCILTMVLGVVAASSIIKVSTIMDSALQSTPYSSSDLLGVEFQQDTILTMVMKLSSGNYKFETLNDLNRVSPMVEKLFYDEDEPDHRGIVNKTLYENLEVEFQWDEIKDLSFIPTTSEETTPTTEPLPLREGEPAEEETGISIPKTNSPLVDYLINSFTEQLQLANIINKFMGENPFGDFASLVEKVLYHTKNVQDVDEEGNPLFDEEGNPVYVQDVDSYGNLMFDDDGNPIYKQEPDHDHPYSAKDFLELGSSLFSNLLSDFRVGDIIDLLGIDTETSPFIGQMSNWRVTDFSDDLLKTIKIGLLLDSSSDNPFIQKIIEENWTVGDLSTGEILDGLKISDFIDTTDASTIIKLLADWTLEDFSTKDIMEEFTIGDLFPAPTSGEDDRAQIIKALENTTLADLTKESTIQGLVISDIISLDEDSVIYKIIGDKTIGELTNIDIQEVKLTDLFTLEDIQANNILNSIYSNNNNATVGSLLDNETIMGLKVRDIISIDEGSAIDKIIGEDTTLQDLTEMDLNEVKLTDLFTENEINNNNVLSAILENNPNATIGTLLDNDTIMGLKVKSLISLTEGSVLDNIIGDDDTLDDLTSMDVSTVKLSAVLGDQIETNRVLAAISNSVEGGATIGDLGNVDIINNLKLEDVLPEGAEEGNRVIAALFDTDTTIGGISTAINDLTLGDVLDAGTDTTSIQYKVVTKLGGYKITEVAAQFGTLTIGDVVEIDENSPEILVTLQDTALNGLAAKIETLTLGECIDVSGTFLDKDAIKNVVISNSSDLQDALLNNLTLGDVVEITTSSPKILQTLADTTLSGLAGGLSDLTLGDMIDLSDTTNKILLKLADVKVFGGESIEDVLTDLKFSDVFSETDCGSGIMKTLWDNTSGGDFKLTDIASKIEELTLVDILGDDLLVNPNAAPGDSDYHKMQATWWFLLTESDETFTSSQKYNLDSLGKGKDYTLSDMSKLVANMEYHIVNESLRDLVDAGFVTVTNATDLEKTIPFGTYAGQKVGDLTISQFMEYALSLIP